MADTRSPAPRPWLALAAAAAVVIVFALFPPFRIVSQKAAAAGAATAAAGAFDPTAFVATFWTGQLEPAAAQAPELAPLLADLRRDPAAARQAHGQQVGLGGPVYFFARGTGRVTAVERSRLIVAIDGLEDTTIAVRIGPVFGNTVRDGCGLLEVNRVPGLQEFNAISAQLNRLVEERVQPALKTGLAVGTRLRFAGCAEAPEQVGDGPLLNLIPVQAEVLP